MISCVNLFENVTSHPLNNLKKTSLVPLCGKEFHLHLKSEIEYEMFICGVAPICIFVEIDVK